MAIFSIYRDQENEILEESFDEVYGHEDSLMEILQESSFEFAQLRAGMYISDCIMEQKIREGVEAEVLYENFAVELFEKIKKMFLTLLNKVKDFFKKLVYNLRLMFTSGKKFIEKFGNDIANKKTTGFEYNAYKYTYTAGENYVAGIYGECASFANDFIKSIEDVTIEKMKKVLVNYSSLETPSAEDLKNVLLKNLKVENVPELVNNIYKRFRDGKEEKSTFKDFNGNSKDQMMKTIKESDNLIKSIEKDRNQITTLYKNTVKSIDTAKRRLKNEENYGKIATAASTMSSAIKFAGSIALTSTRVKISIVKEMSSAFESILKKYLRFSGDGRTGTSESTISTEESIIESALKYL